MADIAERVLVQIVADTNGFEPVVMRAARTQAEATASIEKSAGQAEVAIRTSAARSAQAVESNSRRVAVGYQQLGYQLQDFAVQVASGTSASRALGQQLPQATGALALLTREGSGAAKFLTGPWGIALAIGTALLGPLIEKLFETGETVESLTKKLAKNAAEQELSRQAAEAFKHTEAGRAEAIRKSLEELDKANTTETARQAITLAGARATEAEAESYRKTTEAALALRNAKIQLLENSKQDPSANPVALDVLQSYEKLQRVQEGSADTTARLTEFMGGMNARAAEIPGIIAEVKGEFDAGARASQQYEAQLAAISSMYTLLGGNAEWLKGQIRQLTAEMRYAADLQAELAWMDEAQTPQGREAQRHRTAAAGVEALGLGGALATAALQGESDRHHAATEALKPPRRRRSGGGRAASQARQAESMEENARQTLLLADAYLTSASAAAQAEARRQGLTDAIRRGIATDAQAARQLALNTAQGIAAAAKAVLAMNEETAARRSVLEHQGDESEGIVVSTRSYHTLNREIEESLALQPLLRIQERATGEELAKITRVIDEQRAAFQARNQVLGETAFTRQGDQLEEAARERAARLALVGSSPRWRDDIADLEARQAAAREADDLGLKDTADSARRTTFIDRAADDAAADRKEQRSIDLRGQIDAEQQNLELLTAQEGMLGLSRSQRERRMRLTELELRLNREFGPEYAEQIAYLLALVGGEEDRRAAMERTNAAIDEMHQFGEQLVDDVLDPQNWDNWGDAAKRVLQDIEQELIKLAIANPLKNALFGSELPTLGSGGGLLGFLGGIFGGRSGATAGLSHEMLHFASGGSMTIGGRGGIDQNTLSLNGAPVAKVSRGERLDIVPQGRVPANVSAMGVASARPVVISPTYQIHVSADNSVTPAGFAKGLAREILTEAAKMDQSVLRSVPGRVAQFQSDGL